MGYMGVLGQNDEREEAEQVYEGPKVRYIHTGNNIWHDSNGYPAVKPPWGTLNAIDLNTGEYLWSKTFGEYEELTAAGKAPTGAESFGGPITTASGVLFIAATLDGFIRAYDMANGNELWREKLL